MPELNLTWSPDDEYLGTVHAQVRSAGFTGHSRAWFDRVQLRETFIAALKVYPLDIAAPPLLEGNEPQGATKSLRISVSPHDLRGTLLVRADLANWGFHSSNGDKEHTVTARFLTEYGVVAQFACDFEATLDGTKKVATLRMPD